MTMLQKTRRVGVYIILVLSNAISLAQADEGQDLFKALKQYADFSAASYATTDVVGTVARQYGYMVSKTQTIPNVDLAYFLATDAVNKRQIIAIRGTANANNAYVDMALKLKTDPNLGVRLHEGFAFATNALYDDVKPLLKKDYQISTTGHSLGGAIAVILAMHLDHDQYKVQRVVTYGQPKVTNIAGAVQYKNLPLIRVVTPKDLVPLVPPFDPMDMNNLDIYWHLGEEILLRPGQSYSRLEGMDAMLRAVQFFGQPLTEDNVAHHAITVYLQGIESKLVAPELVPYNHDFDLFGLFGGKN